MARHQPLTLDGTMAEIVSVHVQRYVLTTVVFSFLVHSSSYFAFYLSLLAF